MTQGYKEIVADNIILKRQLADSLEALGARQVCRQGKRVILKGVYNLNMKELVDALVVCIEAAKRSEKDRLRMSHRLGHGGIISGAEELSRT